ncbi:MAG: hypothetical protein AB7S38_41700 [Vulcanimicrobiota bacterium]
MAISDAALFRLRMLALLGVALVLGAVTLILDAAPWQGKVRGLDWRAFTVDGVALGDTPTQVEAFWPGGFHKAAWPGTEHWSSDISNLYVEFHNGTVDWVSGTQLRAGDYLLEVGDSVAQAKQVMGRPRRYRDSIGSLYYGYRKRDILVELQVDDRLERVLRVDLKRVESEPDH